METGFSEVTILLCGCSKGTRQLAPPTTSRSLGLPIFKPANLIDQERKAAPIRVLLVEDDEDYREIVSSELEWHGFAVHSFADGASLLGALDTVMDADIIVLDWRLPNISGIDLLPLLRQRGVNLPAVFLTSHPQLDNESQAFARGAIDFIDKMRGVEILVRRLRLVAGRPAATPCPEKPIVCGKLVLNPNASRATWNEVDVGLTVGEYDIVHLLASNVGDYKSYRAIYDLQYYEGFVAGQGNEGYRTNVRSSIKRIRRKFCEVDPTFSEIQNSQRRGYRWRGLTMVAELGVSVAPSPPHTPQEQMSQEPQRR